MNKSKRILALLCATVMCIALLAGCGNTASSTAPAGGTSTSTPAGGSEPADGGDTAPVADLSKEVNLIYYLWGSEGVANKDILGAINEKLKADLNCTLEIRYIDWGDIATKYPLLFASGEQFDMAHSSPTATPSYYALAAQDVLTDITGMLDLVPTLRDEIPEKTWAGSKYNGQIYGVPTLYSEFTPYGYAYRDDLREKYDLEPITSVETWEAYMQAIVDNESFPPMNANSNDAPSLYKMFVDLTKEWIYAPGIGNDSFFLVAESASDYKNISHPAFSQEFEDWCVKMKEWSDAGYWPNDVLAAETGAKDNTFNGLSAGFPTHMPDWTGAYGTYQERLSGVTVNWWSPAVDNGKVINKPGVDNSTVISSTSANPERALMVIEKLMTDKEYYDLIQYGIEGRQYEVVDGVATKPASYDIDKDAGGFAVWSLRNDRLNIPYATEDPRRYELIEEWKGTAIDNPFGGFTFDPTNISNELAAVTNVNSSEGRQLLFGKVSDVPAAVEAYRSALTAAGVEAIIAELEAQLADWTPIGG